MSQGNKKPPDNPLEQLFLDESAAQATIEQQRKSRIESWTKAVESLYDTIIGWLPEPARSKVNRRALPMHESTLGSYTSHTLEFVLGSKSVAFRPKGTTIIGAKGRVDLIGPEGSLRVIQSLDDGQWSIVFDDPRHPTPLSPAALADAIKVVAYGATA
jgi:hypothetical protein